MFSFVFYKWWQKCKNILIYAIANRIFHEDNISFSYILPLIVEIAHICSRIFRQCLSASNERKVFDYLCPERLFHSLHFEKDHKPAASLIHYKFILFSQERSKTFSVPHNTCGQCVSSTMAWIFSISVEVCQSSVYLSFQCWVEKHPHFFTLEEALNTVWLITEAHLSPMTVILRCFVEDVLNYW